MHQIAASGISAGCALNHAFAPAAAQILKQQASALQSLIVASSKAPLPRLRCCIAQPLTSLCTTHRYVDALMQDVGSPASLKPPIPPLTRYKRDVVAKQQATDLEGAPRLGSTRPASLLHVKYAFPLTSGLLLSMEWAVLHCLHWKQDLCVDLQHPKVSIVCLMCVQPLYYHC